MNPANVTEWLANLSTTSVLVVIAVLLVLRFALTAVKSPATKSVAEIAESLAIAMGLVFLIIRPFFVQAFFIPSESMVPTLLIHDHILVNKTVYLMRDPRPGEVVVFAAPPAALRGETLEAQLAKGRQTDFIKRCAGAPGDTIYVEPSYVEVNGVKLNHLALRTIFADMKSPNHVGEYPMWIVQANAVNGEIEKATDQMLQNLIQGEQPHRDLMSQYLIGDVPVVLALSGAPMVRLDDSGIYVDRHRLTDEEVRQHFPAGAKIEIRPGYIVRNGKKWEQRYLAEDADNSYPAVDPNDPGSDFMRSAVDQAVADKKIQMVTVNGHEAVKLMPGEYLMMGDNRNNSSDSRYWGPLDRDRVKGRALFIFWPITRFGWVR